MKLQCVTNMLVRCDMCLWAKTQQAPFFLNIIIKNQILTAIHWNNMHGNNSGQTGIVISTPVPAVMWNGSSEVVR